MSTKWTDTNGRQFEEWERSGDTFDCADDEAAKLAKAKREDRLTTPKSEAAAMPPLLVEAPAGLCPFCYTAYTINQGLFHTCAHVIRELAARRKWGSQSTRRNRS